MNQDIDNLSNIFGLGKNEAKVYLANVHTGPALVTKIAESALMPRTAVYGPIKSLIKKGFIGITTINRRKYYVAVSPQQLSSIYEQKKFSLEKLVTNLVPKESLTFPSDQLDITYYKGREGVKTAGLLFLNETTEKKWYSFENIASVTDLVSFDFENTYIHERIDKKIQSYMILSTDQPRLWIESLLKKDKEQLRETIILSSDEYPFSSTIAATKGITIIINAQENPYAVIIRNHYIAQTIISIHKNIWERYKK